MTTTELDQPIARSLDQRRADALQKLAANYQLWLATGSDGQGAHLIPVAYVWDPAALTLTTATFERSRTVANLQARPRARVAVGDTADLIMIDATASFIAVDAIDQDCADKFALVSHDPRVMPGLVYLRLAPQRVQVWNGYHEFSGRTAMINGEWLDRPVD